ncbi:nitrate- and nitrite sensing domain-containing protein [Streptomyces collinus]|uniref:sensor histidine kinase n=1 Tax=Streptomyces collinus TaxID=42684 RepID=UPI002942A507|nr:nitrate- and nitrite sensing domain-containing protein [Streptomyces collinus]
MRWPLGRPTTVRSRIVALALAPAVALMALWSFAMVSVTAELRALIRLQGVYEDFGTPVDTAVGQIQIERRMSAAYLGSRRDTAAAGDLLGQQRRTDRAVDALRQAVRDGDRDRLTDRQRQALDVMVAATGKLEGLRERVLAGDITWDRAVDAYSTLVEPGFDVQSTITALQAGQLAREAQVVTELVRVREFVSREDALVAGARAAGTLTDRQYDTLTSTIEDRRVFERTYVPDLPADSRALFEGFHRDGTYRSLVRGEDALLRAGAGRAGQAVAADTWRSTTDRAVKRYMLLCTRSAENSAARGRGFAYRELTKAAVVGAVGLAAVTLSLWLAVRGARRISRRLETLRDAADVLTTRQLPDVMRRLSAGERVDALAEAPPLAADEAGDDEIGQVGRSFNAARHAAVEAAVTQAGLRRGLFAVLLNIARRNQALVHRQLKLVDTLERRTDDPDALRQLFRIDHLTTRMRRHAESLIILSGAAPGRRWRGPVPVADVVASAVSEIEDYTRVVVPPMPETAVAADAVADIAHLLAELLENATVFSPPHTQVTLRPGRVGGGFVLEIDDRGLGLDAEQRAHAERTLTDPDAFDPTRHDRLGLYVVGRLAARHGITVTLRDSPYGGTTAVVLLPRGVLADAEGAGGAGVSAGPRAAAGGGEVAEGGAGAVTGGGARAGHASSSVAEVASAADAGVSGGSAHAPGSVARADLGADAGAGAGAMAGDGAAAMNASGSLAGAASAGGAEAGARSAHAPGSVAGADLDTRVGAAADAVPGPGAGQPFPGRRPEVAELSAGLPLRRRSVPEAAPGPRAEQPLPGRPREAAEPSVALPSRRRSAAGSVPEAPGAPALPTRTRQASLARELREEPPPRAAAPGREIDADEMRAIFGAFQRGLDRGRKGLPAADGPDGPLPDGGDSVTGTTDTTDITDADAATTHADEGTNTDDAR